MFQFFTDLFCYIDSGKCMDSSQIVFNSVRSVHAVSAVSRNFVFLSIGCLTLTISVIFTILGAWPILPFAGLECLGLFLAWKWLKLHEEDHEHIHMKGNILSVNVKNGQNVKEETFNTDWVQVILEDRRPGCRMRLSLRSHGVDLEIGKLLGDNDKKKLAGDIRRLVGNRRL